MEDIEQSGTDETPAPEQAAPAVSATPAPEQAVPAKTKTPAPERVVPAVSATSGVPVVEFMAPPIDPDAEPMLPVEPTRPTPKRRRRTRSGGARESA